MKKKAGIVLFALPVLSVAVYAFTGHTLWVDASQAPARQVLIGALHYISLMGGLAMVVFRD